MTPLHELYHQKALSRMPWATQTNAKRYQPDWEPMPPFIERAQGCRLWDMDGKEYIDYRCALGPIILGYRYPAVDAAVMEQMQKGVLFSMASPIELEAADAILNNVPWAEQIRFMKTGNDASICCVRLARQLTGRDHIISIGYHGFHDWFAAHWPNAGVPAILQSMVHEVGYGDSAALEKAFAQYGQQIAGVIMEPYDWGRDTVHDFVRQARQLCDRHGSMLIYDEVLTGFRMALGGAAAFYGVVPDFAIYAKALANGYPLSAFAGTRAAMSGLDKTILTTTYAGETLSLAASKSVMRIMQEEPVHAHLYAMGRRLREGFNRLALEFRAPVEMYGLEPSQSLAVNLEEPDRSRFYNRLISLFYQQGVFANVRWFVSYSHKPEDIDETLERMRKAFAKL
jgi:glutamate-1-semialdehyde 2,1-aminomutase